MLKNFSGKKVLKIMLKIYLKKIKQIMLKNFSGKKFKKSVLKIQYF